MRTAPNAAVLPVTSAISSPLLSVTDSEDDVDISDAEEAYLLGKANNLTEEEDEDEFHHSSYASGDQGLRNMASTAGEKFNVFHEFHF